MMRSLTRLLLLVLSLPVGIFAAQIPTDLSLTEGALTVRFHSAAGCFEVSDTTLGPVLKGAMVFKATDGQPQPFDAHGFRPGLVEAAGHKEMVLSLGNRASLRVYLVDDATIVFRTEGRGAGPALFRGQAVLGEKALLGLLVDQAAEDRKVLITTNGPAEISTARSLFDPQRDLALTATSPGSVHWHVDRGWQLQAEAPGDGELVALHLQRHYYRDRLGIRYYAPMPRIQRWSTAPVVAMTWYAIEGGKGRPAQTKERLYPNIDWVAAHLLPYAGQMVFQFDDNYAQDDDRYMRELSDYVRSKGLIPGIWIAPFATTPMTELDKHPEWFLRDAQGNLAVAFGGHSYGWYPKNNYRSGVLDPDQAEPMKIWYDTWWRKVRETWNYDFIKADGLTEAMDAFRKAVNGGGIEGFRRALERGRKVVGQGEFINASWGVPPPVEAIGIVNGSRTGGDTGHAGHALGVIVRCNYLNNVCWWSDPDAAANLYKAPVESARLNAQARVLTGQQFLTDDRWTEVPPAICRVWQLSFPTLDIRPANLYEIRDWISYDLLDLRVARPWGTWDVVGLFNGTREPAEKVLDLGRLPLAADEVHVYEFWKSQYLGRFPRTTQIPRRLTGPEGEVFAVVPAAADRPVLLSTSRHVSQGVLDLERVTWTPAGGNPADCTAWTVAGTSSHLVMNDPYELVFVAGPHTKVTVTCADPAQCRADGVLSRVRIAPRHSGSLDWSIRFERPAAPLP